MILQKTTDDGRSRQESRQECLPYKNFWSVGQCRASVLLTVCRHAADGDAATAQTVLTPSTRHSNCGTAVVSDS